MLSITEGVCIESWEVTETFERASGPGGQNVNKVATAVTLRFEAARSPHLDPATKARLRQLAGRKWTKDGALIVRSERFRSQALNREDAFAKLSHLIQQALVRPQRRIATRPGRGAVERRLEGKAQRKAVKLRRGKISLED